MPYSNSVKCRGLYSNSVKYRGLININLIRKRIEKKFKKHIRMSTPGKKDIYSEEINFVLNYAYRIESCRLFYTCKSSYDSAVISVILQGYVICLSSFHSCNLLLPYQVTAIQLFPHAVTSRVLVSFQ